MEGFQGKAFSAKFWTEKIRCATVSKKINTSRDRDISLPTKAAGTSNLPNTNRKAPAATCKVCCITHSPKFPN
jgi:hypothetical protein